MCAAGVLLSSFATGVIHSDGNDEDSRSAVRSSNIGRANNRPFRVIPCVGQSSENLIDSPNKESSHVLDNHDPWTKLANDSEIFKPESRSGPVQTGTLAGVRDVLAGESADEDIDSFCVVKTASCSPKDLGAVAPLFAFSRRRRIVSGLEFSFAVDVSGVGQSRNVRVARHVRPVLPERGSTELVLFALPRDLEAGPLEAEIESADA